MRAPDDRSRTGDPDVPADPLDWRPMRPLATRRPLVVTDPVLEPLWSGTRIIAHVGPAGDGDRPREVRLIDAFGVDLAGELPDLGAELARAVMADDAVIDGVLTPQAMRTDEGVAVVPEAQISRARMLIAPDAGVEIRRQQDTQAELAEESLVALDLLRLDGMPLLDIPLLERLRLLESVVAAGSLVRVTIHTRPPIETWVATWKAMGLRGAMLKSANSRYVPGGRSHEWRAVEQVAGKR